jgi:hypothetical protein
LIVSGAGAGITVVNINQIGGSADGGAITIVQSGLPGASFTVGGTTLNNGQSVVVASTGLVQQFAVNNNGSLVVVAGVNPATIGAVSAGVSSVLSSLNSFSEPASAFVTGPANPDPNKFSVGTWARGRGGEFDIKAASVVDSTASGLGIQTISNTMKTRFQGFQAGLDAGVYNINNSGWNAVIGLHGGQVTGSAGNGDTSISLDQPFYGAYLVVKNDAFTFDAMIRRDEIDMKVSSATGNFSKQTLKSKGWSGLVSAQYRFAVTETITVTPSAAFLFSTIDVNPLTVAGVTTRWSSLNSQVGRLGVDISAIYQLSSTVLLVPFVNASVWHEFAGDVKAVTIAGGNPIRTSTNRVGTYGQVGAGLAFTAPTQGVTGFVRGDLRFGERINGYALNGGMRWQF